MKRSTRLVAALISVFERTDDNAAFLGQFAPEPSAWAGAATALTALASLARRRV